MKTVAKLNAARAAALKTVVLRKGQEIVDAAQSDYKRNVLVCGGTGCTSSNSTKIADRLNEELAAAGIADEVKVILTGCFGLCALGPIMIVYPEGAFYSMVKVEDVPEIVREHFVGGNVVKHLLYQETVNDDGTIKALNETDFYKKQVRVALRNCGVINPEDIYEYIANDGYQALAKVLTEMTPDDVIKCVTDSGLRGRGGGGFPTGRKWALTAPNKAPQKYVVCNADEGDPGAFMDRSVLEGDPGAFMDRSVLEGDPHSVIEGMMLGGYAIGANHGYVYVRAEYPLAVERLGNAIDQAREAGLLGDHILGSDFSFDLEIRIGAGAFVCGEETALLNSVEGRRGEPRQKPPFPFESGLFHSPTIINNVETLANAPAIICKGADWFRSFGTEKSPGTKVFALSGKINNTGLVEVPMGIPLGEILYTIGGGIPNGK
ncbi:MAG: NAD(P)H-dependent oxidoreductase subunit E, partial [Firmicutes bacterium]|nr:NAD(P)H-dependent oxidoreductase subunit E [Bacillota bacterium]